MEENTHKKNQERKRMWDLCQKERDCVYHLIKVYLDDWSWLLTPLLLRSRGEMDILVVKLA